MKNVFYLSDDSETVEIDGAPLIDRTVSEEISQKWEAYYDEEDENDSKPSLFFSSKQVLGMVAAFLCLIPTILLLTYAERTESDLLFFVAILIALPSMIALLTFIRQGNRSRVKLNEATAEKKQLLWQETLEDLRAPANAAMIDVLDYGDPEMPEFCLLLEKAVFWDGDRLCFADQDYRVSLYRDAIRRFRRVTEKLTVIGWNKPTPAGKGIYADVKTKRFSTYIPSYAVLEFTEGGEDYGIWIPYYDVPTVEALIGMKAEE